MLPTYRITNQTPLWERHFYSLFPLTLKYRDIEGTLDVQNGSRHTPYMLLFLETELRELLRGKIEDVFQFHVVIY